MRLSTLNFAIASLLLPFLTVNAHAQLTQPATTTGTNFTQPAPTMAPLNTTNSPTITAGATSNAIEFATEAGRIAGIAKACGQDITLFSTRTDEALNKLALHAPDKILATQSFQVALKQTQLVQTSKNIVPCGQALKDFANLPILRSDYQQTVIANLNPEMNANNNVPINNAPTSTNSPAPVNPNNPAMPNTSYSGTPNASQQNSVAPITSPANANQSAIQNGTPLQQYIDNK